MVILFSCFIILLFSRKCFANSCDTRKIWRWFSNAVKKKKNILCNSYACDDYQKTENNIKIQTKCVFWTGKKLKIYVMFFYCGTRADLSGFKRIYLFFLTRIINLYLSAKISVTCVYITMRLLGRSLFVVLF